MGIAKGTKSLYLCIELSRILDCYVLVLNEAVQSAVQPRLYYAGALKVFLIPTYQTIVDR